MKILTTHYTSGNLVDSGIIEAFGFSLATSAAVLRLRRAHSKNKRERVLPLKGKLLAIVQRRWRLRRPDCEYLFHGKGRPIRDFRTRWQQACQAAGVVPGRAGLTVHDLRRSGVRNMRRAGLREAEVMKITGHRTRNVFDRYNIVSEEDLAAAVDRTQAYVEQARQEPPRVRPLTRADGECAQNAHTPVESAHRGPRKEAVGA